LTAHWIQFITDCVYSAEEGVIKSGAAGLAGIELVGYITQGVWENNILCKGDGQEKTASL